MSDARRILILSAGYGDGHHAAARHLDEALSMAGAVTRRADPMTVLGDAYERSRRRHLAMVTRWPSLWRQVYRLTDLLPVERLLVWRLAPVAREIGRLVRETDADTVVVTHPVFLFLIPAGFASVRRVVVVTDSITINRIWSRAPADLRLCADRYSARLMHDGRVPVVASGFPVSPRLAFSPAPVCVDAPSLWRVLLLAGSVPRETEETAVALARLPGVNLTVAVGRHAALGESIGRHLASLALPPATILGWVDDMPSLLLSQHVLIGKAGGATVHEAMAAHLPMIITRVLPGQEEGNALLMTRLGGGEVVDGAPAAAAALSRWMADSGALWRRRREALARRCRGDGAWRAARAILSA